ncbi:MAG: ribosomal-protein-alanine acetyltransferase [Pseudoalteromonas rhizosphaerae]|jgi:ribosomal-protein-alanine acetyltransferase|uniref:Ribosomal-protein-alanine N-acetyltransferase n=1 Tax=Pseudoalteromonas neustonica TaxID=1840331 RepID=A0ABY3FJI6_9GAMM|nr:MULTISPECIES: ribosomal protein S18-alanine N-acetyltransferase [Pseudoalteromonas]MBB1291755.1 ribosomal protein S18-alanine N-acetyltransferase [Pseudoalteromonas sp. SR41-4]MBB1308469.1 ribosomal protein S18-alanine N-acetyltransferase [Pseudoalteromonas sp. SR41-8]MBB1396548.1 ribosomal protein S18-alanine N-acetyltransferase [Pseudoalteromonas sp. SG44-8]MBB1407708.1 ribosomal protein S18-alanine N-acetyltransferase [Pseudoalteromonas sp. SG44-17]MBB1504039.1 ribosomal protein S18-alan|tara:strand:- start:2583 stop:3689 length:1107 start_codon:yes stop_codon:yes gene_type:complete
MTEHSVAVRAATDSDLKALLEIEQQSFNQDRLSARSFKRWIAAKHGILMVAESEQQLLGYGLVWCHKGTRLARLYSLAVAPNAQGKGVAQQLLKALERATAERGRLFMRLEVAVNNKAAIALYEKLGYRVFGQYSDYYDDHSDALRMQKNIRKTNELEFSRETPWYQQTTEFTCGPAALLMAMSSIKKAIISQVNELDIWREATTIFMTSGHGGCHPLGLALAANKRGFTADVIINTRDTLFVDGVRSDKKKAILHTVHNQFVVEAINHKLDVKYQDLTLEHIERWLAAKMAVVLLISTYRFDGKKSPHWVCVTHLDEHCLYVHDPFCESDKQLAIDCQHVPIAKSDFLKMASFGSSRLSTALAIHMQ